MSDVETDGGGFDIAAGVDSIAEGLGLGRTEKEPVDVENDDDGQPIEAEGETEGEPVEASDETSADETPLEPVTARPAPKSWQKDYHEVWTKIDPKAQEYIELREKQMLDGIEQYKGDASYGKQLRDTLLPYRPIIEAQGLSEPDAVRYLMNAHYALTQGSAEQRKAAYEQLGRNLGFLESTAQPDLDPTVKQLLERQNRIESELTARQQAELQARQHQVREEVNRFAEENPYFEEVADDIAALIKGGYDLKTAYEKAVWANPATRAKELERVQTETAKAQREKAEKEAAIARKATSANVRGRESRKAPTEPKGTMEDTMRDTLRQIRERTH